MTESTLTSKGQITIPKSVRDRLNLRPGDRLDFLIETDGAVRIVPITASVKDLRGMVPKPKRALSLDAMDMAIAKGAAKK